jgi:hypothetical protein
LRAAGSPAHAGIDPGRPSRPRVSAWLPRTRGDRPKESLGLSCIRQAPPHTWGNRPKGRSRHALVSRGKRVLWAFRHFRAGWAPWQPTAVGRSIVPSPAPTRPPIKLTAALRESGPIYKRPFLSTFFDCTMDMTADGRTGAIRPRMTPNSAYPEPSPRGHLVLGGPKAKRYLRHNARPVHATPVASPVASLSHISFTEFFLQSCITRSRNACMYTIRHIGNMA